jgi:hypothetical protein
MICSNARPITPALWKKIVRFVFDLPERLELRHQRRLNVVATMRGRFAPHARQSR